MITTCERGGNGRLQSRASRRSRRSASSVGANGVTRYLCDGGPLSPSAKYVQGRTGAQPRHSTGILTCLSAMVHKAHTQVTLISACISGMAAAIHTHTIIYPSRGQLPGHSDTALHAPQIKINHLSLLWVKVDVNRTPLTLFWGGKTQIWVYYSLLSDITKLSECCPSGG
jgi:hypothetical protein